MDWFLGEDTSEDLKDEINIGVRIGIIRSVNLTYVDSVDPLTVDQNSKNYGTIDIEMLNPSGFQKQVRIPSIQFNKSNGQISIPEISSLVECIFYPNNRVVALRTTTIGDLSSNFRSLRDFVANNTLPQLQEGDHVTWSGNKAFSFIRKCTKLIKQTIGTLLDDSKNPVQVNGNNIHYNLQHESGFKLQIDQNGALIITPASGQKIFFNLDGSSAIDTDALVTRKFLINYYNQFIATIFNLHVHPVTVVSSPTGPPSVMGTQVPSSLPDGVSTPDIRAKAA